MAGLAGRLTCRFAGKELGLHAVPATQSVSLLVNLYVTTLRRVLSLVCRKMLKM
jgi:hypothetical protein